MPFHFDFQNFIYFNFHLIIMPSVRKYNGDPQILAWYKMAQAKLKTKITGNLQTRAVTAARSVNNTLRSICDSTQSHPHWSLIFPNQSNHNYSTILPPFMIPQGLIDNALVELTAKVDAWQGVNVQVMNEPPKAFRKYWTTSDNWWNRYKAIWIGDYFFYPLFHDILYQYITRLTRALESNIKYRRVVRDFLYFSVLHEILFAKITFNRARAQPLILDQCLTKSECFNHLLQYLGQHHNAEWNIPPNDKNNKNRIHVREYSQQWITDILKQKQETYDAHIKQMPTSSIQTKSGGDTKESHKPTNTKSECFSRHTGAVPTRRPVVIATPQLPLKPSPPVMNRAPPMRNITNALCTCTCGTLGIQRRNIHLNDYDDIQSAHSNHSRYSYHSYRSNPSGSNYSAASHVLPTPTAYRPCRIRNEYTVRTHPYHVQVPHSIPSVHYDYLNKNRNTNVYAYPPSYQPQYNGGRYPSTVFNNARVPSVPRMQSLPSNSSIGSESTQSAPRDLPHVSASIVGDEGMFGLDDMSMEFSCSHLALDGSDIFSQEFDYPNIYI
eukprot:365372_1